MKPHVILLSSLLSCAAAGSWAAAQTDPFQRSAPAQSTPSLRTAPPAQAPAGGAAGSAEAGSATPAPAGGGALSLTGVAGTSFGLPRASSDGSLTRVVFDLAPGVTYQLTPTFGGLRIDVRGARVLPAVSARLGTSVSEYRAGGGQVTLVTPFPLSLTDGWRASETTVATGARVLIVEFAPTLAGGASASLQSLVRSTAAPVSPDARSVLSAPLSTVATVTAAAAPAAASTPAAPAASRPVPPTPLPEGLPPGDAVSAAGKTALPLPAPALPGPEAGQPSPLSGRAPGSFQAGAALTVPRLGKNPGLTRVVLDLPPGASYRLVPGGVSLRVELDGVTASSQTGQNVSPELRAWRFEPTGQGVTVTLLTGTPLTSRSGWRAQLLPPAGGSDRSRLAIDLAPALADLTPLSPRDRVVAAVPPVPVTRGTAILALSASLVQPRVVIDPGHGGRDPGAVGTITEKEVTLDVALRVRALLRAAGVDAVLTRETDTALHGNKATDLEMRARTGTPGTQLFLSIHVNAMEARTALRGYGVETWWNPNHPLSSNFATLIQRNVVGVTGAFSQGLKGNRSLSVLRNSRVPAALVEIGYTSHPVDGLNLKDHNYLDRVALGIAQGIREALVSGVTAGGVAAGK
ncbi:N-acetylmuramoyl-L-alanine amidase [Deinococcus aestuarii]|uniref:N-acetylmuramoyl-L-alanine amidase n=1 Tax=Deinococcus aestuarii TaxID=2774531 RepID=UPI001C0B2641|nr:N-acetylmuramoyl-L-alanine amidase [Deinococcus aestuarii]